MATRTVQRKPGATADKRGATINLRLTERSKDLIDEAAAALGKTRTEFVIESASQSAVNVLLDQRLFPLGARQWNAFNDALDNPPPPNARLRQLMKRQPPWEAS